MEIDISPFRKVWLVLYKEILLEYRSPQRIGVLLMFSLTTFSVVSMALGSQTLTPAFLASLLWIVVFFSAIASLAHSFLQEQQTGTIYVLRLYGGAQPVLFGKLLYNLILLITLFLFVVPLFFMFFTVNVVDWELFLLTVLFGAIGMAILMTLLSAFLLAANNQNALFMVISFPILLPLLLFSILLTTQTFQADTAVNLRQLYFLAGYDVVMLGAASVLFDYLWY